MVAGLNTLHGANAARPVGEEVRSVHVLAQTHHQPTEGKSVLDQLRRPKLVEWQNVLVSFMLNKSFKDKKI